jgi:uncharacterized protein
MVYLDTSVAVPLFVAEPSSESVDRWFSACAVPVVSSDWIITEFASALSIKERSGTLNAKDAKAAWRSFETFCHSGLRLAVVSRKAFETAARMTRDSRHGLRAGDALHFAVAHEIGATTIATLDLTMRENAKRLKIKAVVFS